MKIFEANKRLLSSLGKIALCKVLALFEE